MRMAKVPNIVLKILELKIGLGVSLKGIPTSDNFQTTSSNALTKTFITRLVTLVQSGNWSTKKL